MEFGLSEEQVLLQDSVNRFLTDQVPLDEVRKIASGEKSDATIWQGLTEQGIPGLLIPEAQGGVGLGYLDTAIVAECLGHHVTPSPFLSTHSSPSSSALVVRLARSLPAPGSE